MLRSHNFKHFDLQINKNTIEPGLTGTNDSSHLIIYYDLELCDGGLSSEIYQIGANTKNSEFSSFILPMGSIDWGVTKHCGGIKIKTDRYGNRKLFKLSTPIPSVPATEGLSSFIEWMKLLKQNGKYKDVILVAHGSTDMPVLLHNVELAHLSNELKSVVNYFGDSLKYLQNCFPDFDKYNISYIYKKLVGQEIGNAHDALRDAKVLCQIMDETKQGCEEKFIQNILKHTVSIEDGYRISAKQVAESLRKKKLKTPKTSNMKHAPALPSDTLKSS